MQSIHKLLSLLTRKLPSSLSVKLSLTVVGAIALLLLASLAVVFQFSRQTLKDEALQNAEQTLEGTVQHIDNILLSVEQATGNVYFGVLAHLHEPELMTTFCRRLVESNPHIVGCAIVFKPDYFPGHKLFMAYVHRPNGTDSLASDNLIEADSFGDRPYTEQRWYTEPMEKGIPGWIDPLKDNDAEGEALTSFCLPIFNNQGERVGVMAADISLRALSNSVLATKPSPNGYCTLLSNNGSYIVHPDTTRLFHKTVFSQIDHTTNASAMEVAEAMLAGETGYGRFRLYDNNYYVFYKPFERTAVPGRITSNLGWSAGVIYPEDDIFKEYNQLLYYVLAIAIIGLLLLYMLCHTVFHRQLQPLQILTHSARRIAAGHYDEIIPDARQHDEIGLLQANFQKMQQSLSTNINELEKLKTTLSEHGDDLREAYRQAQEADHVKTTFMHKMTNQMISPAESIIQDVDTLCNISQETTQNEAWHLAEDIHHHGKTITDLLDQLLEESEKE
jgi:methyl-accepting chemotaxis protein/sigma-B regulation protein RsbU (phosphoserine phosphatase)